jgi:hypothetical protein
MKVTKFHSVISVLHGPYEVRVIREEPIADIQLGERQLELTDRIRHLPEEPSDNNVANLMDAVLGLPNVTSAAIINSETCCGIAAEVSEEQGV